MGFLVLLLHEAGLVWAVVTSHHQSRFSWRPVRLTMAGHEYLDTIRDEEIWPGRGLALFGDTAGTAAASAHRSLRRAGRSARSRCQEGGIPRPLKPFSVPRVRSPGPDESYPCKRIETGAGSGLLSEKGSSLK